MTTTGTRPIARDRTAIDIPFVDLGRQYGSIQEQVHDAFAAYLLTKTPLCSQEAVVIGISMSFLDVHVNRAPIAGRITLQRHLPGRFGSLRGPEMVFENATVCHPTLPADRPAHACSCSRTAWEKYSNSWLRPARTSP